MPENEENIENVEQTVEQPVITQWKIDTDEVENVISLEEAFKPKVEVVEEAIQNVAEQTVEQPAVEQVDEEVVEDATEDNDYVELDENLAIEYLAEKRGMTVEEFQDSLKPKEQEKLDADLEAYLKYKKETNRSYQDWLETQKDFSQEPKENVLLMNLRLENPTLTDKQINRLYEKQYAYDPEFDDEDEITDKEINIERDYQKGLAKLESQKEQYKVVRGSDELVPEEYKSAKELVDNWKKQQEENKIAIEQAQKDFLAKTENVFNANFEGFKVNVGDKEFKVKPENVELAKKNLSDLSNFDKKFFDEKNTLKDPEGYYRALYFADNPDKMAEHFINIGRAIQAEEDEKESKNIVAQRQNSQLSPLNASGKKWQVIND